ncbi:hypothetical protein ACFV5M_09510 [Streptomyces albidoflavus]
MAAVPQDLLDRIRTLERQVRDLTGRAQMRPALSQIVHGTIVVGEGGQFIAQTPEGTPTFAVGQTTEGDWGIWLGRADGSQALTVGDDFNEPTQQMVRMWSRDKAAPNRVLVMDDAHSDRFLGRPWIPIQLHPTARQSSTQNTYEQAWWGGGPAFNPVARITVSTYANAGGQVRIRMNALGADPTTVEEWTVAAGSWATRTVLVPMHGIEYMEHVTWSVDHRSNTAGQNIETRLQTATGRNTANASEAPRPPSRPATARSTPAPAPSGAEQADTAPAREPGLHLTD